MAGVALSLQHVPIVLFNVGRRDAVEYECVLCLQLISVSAYIAAWTHPTVEAPDLLELLLGGEKTLLNPIQEKQQSRGVILHRGITFHGPDLGNDLSIS